MYDREKVCPKPIQQGDEVEVGPSNPSVSYGSEFGQFRQNDFSISFWLQTNEKLRSFDVAGNRITGGHGVFICLRMIGTHESLTHGVLTYELDEDGRNYSMVTSKTGGLNDGNWHHIVALRQATEQRLYVDGKLSAKTNGPGIADVGNGLEFKLGKSWPNATPAKMKFNNLGFYDIALEDDDVEFIFSKGKDYKPPKKPVYEPDEFDEGLRNDCTKKHICNE